MLAETGYYSVAIACWMAGFTMVVVADGKIFLMKIKSNWDTKS
jgi:hypothetical protein